MFTGVLTNRPSVDALRRRIEVGGGGSTPPGCCLGLIDRCSLSADTSKGSTTFDAQTKLKYNGPKQVPTSVDEYATERKSGGVTGIYTTVYQTTISLASDSLAAKQ